MMSIREASGWTVVWCFFVAGCGGSAAPTAPTPPVSTPAQVLVVTHTAGFRHDSIAAAEATIARVGQQDGSYQTTFCRTAADVQRMLTVTALTSVDAVVFANTTGDLGISPLAELLHWVASGRGFVGIHSAADTYQNEPGYLQMLGNRFVTHGDQTTVEAVVENSSHPAVAHLGSPYTVFDEIYRFAGAGRADSSRLLTLLRAPLDGLPDAGQAGDLPLAWFRTHGSGRVFYTALGHREELWRDARFQQHVLGGIRWALGR